VYFHLPALHDPRQTVFGISCYRQIDADKVRNLPYTPSLNDLMLLEVVDFSAKSVSFSVLFKTEVSVQSYFLIFNNVPDPVFLFVVWSQIPAHFL
jgi:hypothetical protein